jgi:uncharacterized metal-binding protein
MSDAQVCTGGETLIFACSGAADVGAVSDQAARRMMRDGKGKMFCLAGLGGQVEPIIAKTKSAKCILALDGCGLDCAKKCLQQVGITDAAHLRVTDLGMEKGQTPLSDENVAAVIKAAGPLLD